MLTASSSHRDDAQEETGDTSIRPTSPDVDEPVASVPEVLSERDRKLAALHDKNRALEAQLADLQAQHDTTLEKLQNPTDAGADATVKYHIKLLHDYNETRDVGLGLMGLIAENRGCRVQDVMPEFGLKSSD